MSSTPEPVIRKQQEKIDNSVEAYMRMAGQLLSEIIIEWNNRQKEKNQARSIGADHVGRRKL